jgi:hypothetical protein
MVFETLQNGNISCGSIFVTAEWSPKAITHHDCKNECDDDQYKNNTAVDA